MRAVLGRRGAPTVVDDRDSSISYSAGWSLGSDPQGNDGTVTSTTQDGAFATYKFTGTSIQVFGQRLPADHINATFNLDGTSTFYIKPNAQGLQQHQVLFYNNTVSDGAHTLTITNHGQSLLLDFFEVVLDAPAAGSGATTTSAPASVASTTNNEASTTSNVPSTIGNAASTTSGASDTSSSANPTSLSSGASTTGPNPSALSGSATTTDSDASAATGGSNASDASGSSAAKGPGAGAYAGIGVGVAVLLLALLGAWWWWRRRRGRSALLDEDGFPALRPEKYRRSVRAVLDEDVAPAAAGFKDEGSSGLPSRSVSPAAFPAYGYRGKAHGVVASDATTPSAPASRAASAPGEDVAPLPPRLSGATAVSAPAEAARSGAAGAEKAGEAAAERLRGSGREAVDGGVRLAGGPPDMLPEEAGWAERGEGTRPPPYHRY